MRTGGEIKSGSCLFGLSIADVGFAGEVKSCLPDVPISVPFVNLVKKGPAILSE
jgi:hypothetical protein